MHDDVADRDELRRYFHRTCELYERLFDLGYLRELWTEITGREFHVERARQLIDMHVEWRM